MKHPAILRRTGARAAACLVLAGVALACTSCGPPAARSIFGPPSPVAREVAVRFGGGAPLPTGWRAIRGTWAVAEEGLVCRDACDGLIDTGLYLEGAYRLEAWIRPPAGERRGPGLRFGIGRAKRARWGMTVHLHGADRLHAAVVRAGRRTAVAAPKLSPTPGRPRHLVVDVRPRSVIIRVDGERVTGPIALDGNEGFVALEGGRGGGTFLSFRTIVYRHPAHGPHAIAFAAGAAVDGFGRIIVADRSRHNVLVYSPEGVLLARIGPPEIGFRFPEAVAIGRRETILIADTGNERIAVLDWSGRFLRAIPAASLGMPGSPRWIASDRRGRCLTASPGSGEVIVFDESGRVLYRTGDPFRRPEAVHLHPSGEAAIADPGQGVCWFARVERDGRLRVTGRVALRGTSPRAIAIDPAGRLLAAQGDDVLAYDLALGTRRSWWTPLLGDIDIQALALDRDGRLLGADGANHRLLRIDDPSVVLRPEVEALGPRRVRITWRSREAGPTLVRYGTTRVPRRRVVDAAPTTTHRIELEGLEPATRYFFRVSGADLSIPAALLTPDLDFVTPPSPGRAAYREVLFALRVPPGRESAARAWAEQARLFWWAAARMRLAVRFAIVSGDAPPPSAALAVFAIVPRGAPNEPLLQAPGPTCGIPGRGRWPDPGADGAALLVRAVHRALGELARVSGHAEVPSARHDPGAPVWGDRAFADRVPPWVWLALEAGTLRVTGDTDGDGIPDADPAVPLDEARLGSDPTRADTDGDGVPDPDEVRFACWLDDGWGESGSTARPRPDLRGPDADGDGVPDGEDREPLAAVPDALPASAGPVPRWVPFGTVEGPGLAGAFRIAWFEGALRIAWRGRGAGRLQVVLHGRRSPLRIRADLATGAVETASIGAPFSEPESRADVAGIRLARAPGAAEIEVPSLAPLGLVGTLGTTFQIGVAAEDAAGRMRAPGEPNRPVDVRLVTGVRAGRGGRLRPGATAPSGRDVWPSSPSRT